MLFSKWCFIFVSFSYLLIKHCFIIKLCFDASCFQNNVSSLVLNSHLSHYHWKWIKSRRTKPTNKFLPPFWIPIFCLFLPPKSWGGGGYLEIMCLENWHLYICQHLPWQNKIISQISRFLYQNKWKCHPFNNKCEGGLFLCKIEYCDDITI